jgi:polyhydroxybutyrate depolymerase
MTFASKLRTYLLATPTDYDAAKSYPLVLSFHGNPGQAEDQAKYLPFDSVSGKAAIIAYPQGDDSNWDLYTPTDDNADMTWIAALPDEIASKRNIDKTHVFGFGYSGGAFFLPQFTCRFGGIFKAISVNAGGGPDEEQMGFEQYDNGCYKCPGGPIAAIITHGASDTTVLPSSGEFTHTCYATFNGCSDTLSPSAPAPCQQHDGCPADKPVKWCLIPGQTHAAWSQAMSAAWGFFTSLP